MGIKYLTLNWSENPNQNLFDPKDEIADKILYFIEDSFTNGEGILAHSLKGQNRVCIVVLIYLMKKYKWNLKKSMQYIKSKKKDVHIPRYFFNQLFKFESRLKQRGILTNNIPWSFENIKDPKEKIMRNTYINGLKSHFILKKRNSARINNSKNLIHVAWMDIEKEGKAPLSVTNCEKDLYLKKKVKPIVCHMKNNVLKSCFKNDKRRINYPENKGMLKNQENKIENSQSQNFICIKNLNSQTTKNIITSLLRKSPSNANQNKLNLIYIEKRSKKEIEENRMNKSGKNDIIENNLDEFNIDKIKPKNKKKGIISLAPKIDLSLKNNVNTENENNLAEANHQQSYKRRNKTDFANKELINYKKYNPKEIQVDNNKLMTNINNKKNMKEKNIIIITNKYDNIIKNNINNYYINQNQIGKINNHMKEKLDVNDNIYQIKRKNNNLDNNYIENDEKNNQGDKLKKINNKSMNNKINLPNYKNKSISIINNNVNQLINLKYKENFSKNNYLILSPCNQFTNKRPYFNNSFNGKNNSKMQDKNNVKITNILDFNKGNNSNRANINLNKLNHNFNIIDNRTKESDNNDKNDNIFSKSNNNINNNNFIQIVSNRNNPIKKKYKVYRTNYSSYKENNDKSINILKNLNNTYINSYNVSLIKNLNNYNPNLIKRKGTPVGGIQKIKLANVNNHPIKLSHNNKYINLKRAINYTLPINKSSTLVNNNSYTFKKVNDDLDFNIKLNNICYNNFSSNTNRNNQKKLNNFFPENQRPLTAPHRNKKNNNDIKLQNYFIGNKNNNNYIFLNRSVSARQSKKYNIQKEKDKEITTYDSNNKNNDEKKNNLDLGIKKQYSFTLKINESKEEQNKNNKKTEIINENNNRYKIGIKKNRIPSPFIPLNFKGNSYKGYFIKANEFK